MTSRGRVAVVTGVLLLSALAGCGDDDASPSAEPEETGPPISAFAAAINPLCSKLSDDALAVTGGGSPEVVKFNADQPALKKLTDAFDAEVAKIPLTTPEDQQAAAAFKTYQQFSDTGYAKVIKAAKANDQKKFDDAFDEFLASFDKSPAATLDGFAITCPAR